MVCEACNNVPNCEQNEDCFDKALNVLKQHYAFYKNAMLKRDIELEQVKERNAKLNKALKFLQTNQQQKSKRFKTQHSEDFTLGNICSQEERVASEYSLTDDEQMEANNLNMALNSEQLFDISSLNETNTDVSRSSTEAIQSPRPKVSPERNKQHNLKRCLKDRNNTTALRKTKTEWHGKERNSPVENTSWAMKFIQPAKKANALSKQTVDKKLSLSLKKPQPSKTKQSLLHFNKLKEESERVLLDVEDDIIEASPVVVDKNSKATRSWSHRSLQNSNKLSNETNKNDDDSCNKTLDDIVFDFSPSKKTDSLPQVLNNERLEPKTLTFCNENYSDCITMPNANTAADITTNNSDTSSVMILTPGTQDIIFVEDDTCNLEPEIDTMDLLADNLDKLKKYESKCLAKQQQSKDLVSFVKPATKATRSINDRNIKQEKITQDNLEDLKLKQQHTVYNEEPSCSNSKSNLKTSKQQNPLLSTDEHDTEDEDFMPKPFIIKQEPENSKKLAIKQRFNINCEHCEKLIDFLDEKLTDAQIQQHLDKCKHSNIMRQNTPNDFWNPFILSFQADDPRNEILIDTRFKDNKK